MQQSTAPDDAKWTSENDTRITRVGHILRLTHLDELPQLLNIFMGRNELCWPAPLWSALLFATTLAGQSRELPQPYAGYAGPDWLRAGQWRLRLNPCRKLSTSLIYIFNPICMFDLLVPAKNNTCYCFYIRAQGNIFCRKQRLYQHFVMRTYRAWTFISYLFCQNQLSHKIQVSYAKTP